MDITSPTKRPVGRPCEYKPEYCEIIRDMGEEGASKIEMVHACGARTTATFDDWADKFVEFSNALMDATVASQAWWEKQGRLGVFDGEHGRLNSCYTKQMAARFPKTWRENTGLELSGGIKTIAECSFAARPDGD